MIEAICTPYLDGHKKERWPTWFVALPRIGDLVESTNGTVVLYINQIKHRITSDQKPFIEVHLSLHKP